LSRPKNLGLLESLFSERDYVIEKGIIDDISTSKRRKIWNETLQFLKEALIFLSQKERSSRMAKRILHGLTGLSVTSQL